MKSLVRFALTIGAVALFADCEGSRLPSGMVQSRAIASTPNGNERPLRVAPHRPLLYAMAPASVGYILTYPRGKQVGFIGADNFFQYGLCANDKGQVFLSAYIPMADAGIVARYVHGSSKPNKFLYIKHVSFESCSVDPVTGHIAATAFTVASNIWEIAIFQDINDDNPVYYKVLNLTSLAFCGYDDIGNLFVDGGAPSGAQLAELPAGGKQFVGIKLSQSIASPGTIQWADGSLTIEDLSGTAIDRVNISGSIGTITGQTILKGAQHQIFQSSIYGSTVIAAFGAQGDQIGFWRYPQGGQPRKTLSGLGQINGLTVSVAPSR